MYMYDSETCTCKAVKHVHVKQSCSPGKRVFLSEKDKVQHRARVMTPSMATSTTQKIGS